MAGPRGKTGTWLGIAGAVLGPAAFIAVRVHYLRSHGQNIFWLAELFSPMAVFSVLIVTFVDKLVAPQGRPRARGKKAR